MIKATAGIVARYKQTMKTPDGGVREYHTTKPVLAFDGSGTPLVLGDRGLVDADQWNNFDGVVHDADGLYVSLIPGGGWMVKYTEAGVPGWSSPVVAWGLRPDGQIDALGTDSDGVVHTIEEGEIYHPDSVETAVE